MNKRRSNKIHFEDGSPVILPKTQKREKLDSFQKAIGLITFLGQCLGIMPVIGILSNNRNAVKFKWIAFRTIYSLLILACGFSELLLSVYRIHVLGMTIGNVEALTFYAITVTGQICFFNLAMRWPRVIRCWDKAEYLFLSRPYRILGWTLDFKVKILFMSWILLACVEYSLYVCTAVIGISNALEICPDSEMGVMEIFYRSQRSHIFMWINFQYWMIPFLNLINVSLTFCWTFLDVFIMIIGISLSTRFYQITDRITRMAQMNVPDSFWIEVRSHYLILNELVLYVDNNLSLLILLSCASNLYFVCLQLFNSFTSNYTDLLSTIYFWFSLLFVIGRAISVLLCAASIHESTKTPLRILRNIPTRHWSIELGRFAYAITRDTIALTGRRFFYLTKGLVLMMAGTVVTYELVVFDQVDLDGENSENSTHPCNWTKKPTD